MISSMGTSNGGRGIALRCPRDVGSVKEVNEVKEVKEVNFR